MAVDDRMRAQASADPGRTSHRRDAPAADQWDDVDNIDYFYRAYAILVREPDAARVADALAVIFDQVGYGDVAEGERGDSNANPSPAGSSALTVPSVPTGVPDLVAPPRRDGRAGRGKPEHKIYVCPWYPAPLPNRVRCRIARPLFRRLARTQGTGASPGPGTTGTGVSVSHRGHRADPAGRRRSSVAGRGGRRGGEPVRRRRDDSSVRRPRNVRGRDPALRRPEGKRSSSSGLSISRAPTIETRLASSLADALEHDPDIMVFTFTAATHRDPRCTRSTISTKGAPP